MQKSVRSRKIVAQATHIYDSLSVVSLSSAEAHYLYGISLMAQENTSEACEQFLTSLVQIDQLRVDSSSNTVKAAVYEHGFDGWTTINADGDDHNWYHSNDAANHSTAAITSHSGAGHLMSESYCNATYDALTPDEYVVSPASQIANGSIFSFWACAQDESYCAEHFGIAISTSGNTSASDFTTIAEWTMTAKGGNAANPAATRNGKGTREGNWYFFSADLSSYAGETAYLAVRHFNCSDEFILCVDDAELSIGTKATRDILFDQAQYVTDPGQINGYDASNLQGAQSTYGPNVNYASSYYLADDFTLTEDATITGFEVYGYQTGSTTTSTFTGLYAQIYDGNPMNGGQVIWGNTTDNLITATDWTQCYRANNDNGTTRPIMSITASGLEINLPAGQYWLANYAGCYLTQAAVCEYSDAGTYTLNIYFGGATPNAGTLVHSQDFTCTGTTDWHYITLTSVEENSTANIYPNPTTGNVTIEASGMNHITVVSALGQVVYDADVEGDMMSMNMAQYNAGVYVVRINTVDGVVVCRLTVVR